MANLFRNLWPFGKTKVRDEKVNISQESAKERVLNTNIDQSAAPADQEPIDFDKIDIKALMGQAPDDIINRFLSCTDLKIVVDDSAKGDGNVQVEAEFSEEDDIVSEELAKIYLSQGLKNEAIEIYRKLSLLNSEKSIYFAKLIAIIENK